eukprot:1634108-Prorocentrum_lima.AAC.1
MDGKDKRETLMCSRRPVLPPVPASAALLGQAHKAGRWLYRGSQVWKWATRCSAWLPACFWGNG